MAVSENAAVSVLDLMYGRGLREPALPIALPRSECVRERKIEKIGRLFDSIGLWCSSHRAASAGLIACAFIMVVLAACVLFPEPAYAVFVIDDIVNALDNWVKEMLGGAIDGLFGMMISLATDNNNVGILTASWDNLFAGGSANFAGFVSAICNTVVKPVAASVLVFVCLVQLIKISSRMDSSGTMPAVREIMVLFVMLAIFMALVQHSDEICIAIYDTVNNITVRVQSLLGAGGVNAPNFAVSGDLDNYTTSQLMSLLIGALLGFIIAAVAYMIVIVMSYARALQLYIMMAFSPLPLALLGIDETRSFGVGFIKNFVAVALAGTIMYVILVAYPYVMGSVVSFGDPSMLSIIDVLKVVGVSLLLALAIFKSGAWARDILGS